VARHSLVFNAASSQYVTMGDVLSLFNDQLGGVAGQIALTFGVCVKTTQTTLASLLGRNYFGAQQGRYGVNVNDTANHATEGLFQDSGGTNIADHNPGSGGSNDGSWHSLIFATDSVGGALYLDGSSVATWTTGGAANVSGESTTKFLLGAADSGGGITGYFTGKLTQAFVAWQKVTGTQAANIANGSLDPASLASIKSLWNGTNGSGTTLTDDGPAGHNGTLTNGVTWDTDLPSWLSGGGGGMVVPRLRSARNRALLRM
jgi:hypothetical protein